VPILTFRGAGPLVVNVHFVTTTVRDVVVEDLGEGMVRVELADAEIGVRLVGPVAVIHALIVDTDRLLTQLRNH
jgi:hypothetical protein